MADLKWVEPIVSFTGDFFSAPWIVSAMAIIAALLQMDAICDPTTPSVNRANSSDPRHALTACLPHGPEIF